MEIQFLNAIRRTSLKIISNHYPEKMIKPRYINSHLADLGPLKGPGVVEYLGRPQIDIARPDTWKGYSWSPGIPGNPGFIAPLGAGKIALPGSGRDLTPLFRFRIWNSVSGKVCIFSVYRPRFSCGLCVRFIYGFLFECEWLFSVLCVGVMSGYCSSMGVYWLSVVMAL